MGSTAFEMIGLLLMSCKKCYYIFCTASGFYWLRCVA